MQGVLFEKLFRPLGKAWPILPFMAYGCLALWADLIFVSDVCLGADASHLKAAFAMWSGAGFICVALAAALFADRAAAILQRVSVQVILATFMAAAVVTDWWLSLAPANDAGVLASVMFPLATFMTGVGSSALTLAAARPYVGVYPRRSFTNVALAIALGNLVFLGLGALPPWGALTAAVVLPFLAVFLLRFSYVEGDCEPAQAASGKTGGEEFALVGKASGGGMRAALSRDQLSALLKLPVVIAFIAFCSAMPQAHLAYSGIVGVSEMSLECALFTAVVSLVFASLVNLPLFRSFRPYARTCYVASGVLIAALLLSPFVARELFWFSIVAGVLYRFFDLIMWGMFATVVFGYDVPYCRVFGAGRMAFGLGTLLAWGSIGLLFSTTNLSPSFDFAIPLFCVLALVVSFLLFRYKEFQSIISCVELRDLSDRSARAAVQNGVSSREAGVEAFAAAMGLSERERQTLDLIVNGRSVSYIAQQMLVSPSTVKTHMKNIYRKADVHGKSELLDAIETYCVKHQ